MTVDVAAMNRWLPMLGTALASICLFGALAACSNNGTMRPASGSGGHGGAPSHEDASSTGGVPSNDASSGGGTVTTPNDTGPDAILSEAGPNEDAATSEHDASDGEGRDGAVVSASCAGGEHPVCIDFEDGKVVAPWTLPATHARVEEGNAAHGRYAMHVFDLHSVPKNGAGPAIYLHTGEMGGIKDVLWGRFYLYLDPGAPVGHGVLVRANDMQTNWHEVGFEANARLQPAPSPTPGAFFGDWHAGNNAAFEKYARSHDTIPQKRWVCVEFYLDGAAPALPRVWGDGTEVVFDDFGGPAQTIEKAVKFVSFDIGIVFYHGGSLTSYSGDTAPYITDEWLDDIALDTTRVGCL